MKTINVEELRQDTVNRDNMKATISWLWDTGRELISYAGNEFERPQSFAELKKCENVIIGDKLPGTKVREVLIDNTFVLDEQITVRHPGSGSAMIILEIQ